MMDINSLALNSDMHEIVWDYCLENDIITPGTSPHLIREVILSYGFNISGARYTRGVLLSQPPIYFVSYSGGDDTRPSSRSSYDVKSSVSGALFSRFTRAHTSPY